MPDVHSLLTDAAAWPADLVTAGIVSAAAQVYTGRRPQSVTRLDKEVWLERLAVEQVGTGLQGISRHPYLVHVICKGPSNAGPAGTGDAQLDVVEDDLRTIAERYQGACPFAAEVTGMVHAEASEEDVDLDPEDETMIVGTARVVFTVAR